MKFEDIRREAVFSGATRCSIGAALATSSLYTIGHELAKSKAKEPDEKLGPNWLNIALGVGEGAAAAALIANGVSNLRRF